MVAPRDGVHRRRPAELAGRDDERFVQKRLSRLPSRQRPEVFDEAGETLVEPLAVHVVIYFLAAIEYVAVLIPPISIIDVDETRSRIRAENVARQN